jgi:hypothetical protein
MTVLDRIDKYLAVITKMHMDDRPRLIDTRIEGDKKFYPIATFEDLRDTLQLMGRASSTIRPYIADWYNTVFLPAFEVLDGKALEIKTENGYLVGVEIAVGVNSKILQEKTLR